MEHILGVVQNGPGVVGKYHFHLSTALLDQAAVILHVVNTGKGVLDVAEQLPITLFVQYILVGVYALLVHQVPINQVVAHFIGGVAEHQDYLLAALGDAPQADGKAVTAEDGENHTHSLSAQLGANILSDVVNGDIVALRAGHDGFGHSHDVPVSGSQSFLHSLTDTVHNDLGQVISLTNDGSSDTHRNGTKHPAHTIHSCSSNRLAIFAQIYL